jgi:soluble lytic murein transglycosylase-like protein
MYGYLTNQQVSMPLPKAVYNLVNKIEKNKEKLSLEYSDRRDLEDTVYKIWVATKGDKNFNMSLVTSIAICESRLNPNARNRMDGGKGLMQVMHKYWKEEIPWYRNPFDKDESIRAGITVLNIIKSEHKCSNWKAVQLYNGKCYKAKMYQKRVYKVYQTLKA